MVLACSAVKLVATSRLPTRWGTFKLYAFQEKGKGAVHVALARGKLRGAREIPVRLHSQCLTGDGLGSLRCDCRDQLEAAMIFLGKQKTGALLYLMQEGRGIGLGNKIRAYALQDAGMDTVEANRALGLPVDARSYKAAAGMLKQLGVRSVTLITNNPAKVLGLEKYGIPVKGRIAIQMPATKYDRRYLETKKLKMKHWLK
ncbi:MAG: GTP cyclohydrolase II [Candidatus Micrarchaeota archaeon]|nr:GTP cyclohydrolase II [Candidatus Micrarchaeota archaeon]